MVTIVFDRPGDFEACNAAEKWCRDRGISVGEMQGPAPRGLLVGDFWIAKWRNLNAAEKRALNGRMTGDMRHGPVTVTFDGDVHGNPVGKQRERATRTKGSHFPINGNQLDAAPGATPAANVHASGDES
ncbi:hypothetical protein KDX27_34930 [Burkholderia cenocepacia]|uniref:hypothetical protein n=1 Tax=Burkholderia cenocepacia TaxID=95486 RepID=UPI001B9D81D0|nr:hypothetical protein [Burkholderia cenocepacia]MBR8029238.1 hypothetical protein [Burkholderia cenocepacia]MBR8172924.1 hypothetical protein [Burkholderia cenocepacia]